MLSRPSPTDSGAEMFPPQSAQPRHLQEVRESFARLGYTAEGVCARAGCATMYDFQTRRAGRKVGLELNDALDALIRLFMDGEHLTRAQARALLPGELLDAL